MRFKLFLLLAFLSSFILLFFLPTQKKSKRLVVCTTTIIADAVSAIAEDTVTIKTLMGSGVDPHMYRPRESDVAVLSSADLIFYNGLHLEGKMAGMFEHMRSRVPTIALAESLDGDDLIETEFIGIYDPHFWHDVALWKQVVGAIVTSLCVLYPEQTERYKKNARHYEKSLSLLQEYIQSRMSEVPLKKRILLTAHDAFSYLGKAYGFEVIGLQGISTDAHITAHDIQSMAEKVTQCDVPAIFLESSLPAKSIAAVERAVEARGRNVKIAPELFSDSLGDKTTTADTYCGMIKHNVDVIVNSLTT